MVRRRTKIVATLGPASSSAECIRDLLQAGVNVCRLNFSHGTPEEQLARAKVVRDCAEKMNLEVGLLADLQGPKIRIARFSQGQVTLSKGDSFALDATYDQAQGSQQIVGVNHPLLSQQVAVGNVLLLDDGKIQLEIERIDGQRVHCRVLHGGKLSDNKGLNKQGGGLAAPAITDKDRQALPAIARMEADYVAISFVCSAAEVTEAKKLLKDAGITAGLVTKIERREALDELDAIINASDAVMVARGDLGVELGDAELPAVQKRIISRARALNKVVITATQMMESMIDSVMPTRAEVFDVANAVLDGTDAVMLSAETASGNHPVETVEAMSRACLGAEKHPAAKVSKHRLECEFTAVDEAIAMAAMYTANHFPVAAIVALTESGATPRMMSRIRSGMPIFAMSKHPATRRRLTLVRGVYPYDFDASICPRQEVNRLVVQELATRNAVKHGETLLITKGDFAGVAGGSNTMKLVQVGQVV